MSPSLSLLYSVSDLFWAFVRAAFCVSRNSVTNRGISGISKGSSEGNDVRVVRHCGE